MIKTKLPVIVLRNLVLLPNGEIKLELSNDIDKEIITNSVNNHDSYVILVSTLSLSNENIDISELPNTGIIGKITSYFDLPNNHLRITISGVNRANIFNYVDTGKSKLDAVIGPAIYEEESVDETEANLRLLKREFAGYISITQSISNSIIIKMNEEVSLDKLTDIVANILPLSFEKKNKFIYMTSPIKRSNDLIKYIAEEKNISYIEKKLDESVKKELDKSQKEFILKEKLRAIKEELGEKDDKDEEINEIAKKSIYDNKLNKISDNLYLSNRQIEILKRYEIDYKNGEGRIITNICLYDEYIYSVEEIVADGVSDYAITVYNEQGKFEKTIEMSDYKDDVFNTAISQIYVNGQYLFITNFMDTTLIGSIEDGEIKKIQLEKNLSIAQNSMPSYKNPVLYMRESSIFYAFDEEKGKLLKYDISEDFESYYISYMAQDNKGGVWMYLTDENNEEVRKFHYFAKEEF